MSTFRNPVGPQEPQVYWRRRLAVGVGILAVIIIVILIIVRPGSGGSGAASPGSTKKPVAESSASPSPSPSSTASTGDCLPANIKLEAVTDNTTYGSAVNPMIGMTITNTGSKTCTVNAGTTQQNLVVTSGSETIWQSKDCQVNAVDFSQVLEPNKPVSTPTIAWDRTRSAPSTCAATDKPKVTAGGASYHLSVSLGQVKSKQTVQFILN
ncbi:hypothetical protein [Lacisediminihabitans changchengi]|uniref:DUF4232 domain-containing protein n=1 Tax=Lacisediminihabitans changchengi TaxID=2787634 RepID=A0A934W4N8_9MICO|nr:hypothetical protein [Lacisediminihabitans changchengi]MBK4348469.1 hypothetical protein [Lacisediminihabitans changchengi]